MYATARIYSSLYSHLAVFEFWGLHGSLTAGNPTGASPRSPGVPDFRLWSEKRIEAYRLSLVASVPPPLGVLRIPSVDLEVPVLEGTDDLTLNRAVGHIAGTSALDQGGNVGIAGHRDGFFRELKDAHLGDSMDLYTEKGNSHYVVDEIVIVPPEDVSVLRAAIQTHSYSCNLLSLLFCRQCSAALHRSRLDHKCEQSLGF